MKKQSFLKMLYIKIISLAGNRWSIVDELCDAIQTNSNLDTIDERHLTCLCYAPNVGYRSWIFRYKGVLVALCYYGNGLFDFHTTVSHYDLYVARILFWLGRRVNLNEVFY